MRSLIVVVVTMMLATGCKSVSQNTSQKSSITIHEAAEKGNIESIKNHCNAGTDLNKKDKKMLEDDLRELNSILSMFEAGGDD